MDNPQSEKMTPLARRIAAEQNLDLLEVNGSGYAGKIYTYDLKNIPGGFSQETKQKTKQETKQGPPATDKIISDETFTDEPVALSEFVMPEFLFDSLQKEELAPIEIPPLGKLIEFPKSPSFRFEHDIPEYEAYETETELTKQSDAAPIDWEETTEIQAREAMAAAVKDADEYVAGVLRMNDARRAVAARTAKSSGETVAVTQHMETDVSELLTLRNHISVSRETLYHTLIALYIKAIAVCVREFSRFRFRLAETGDAYLLIEGGHIGLQVNVGDSVATPVIKNADKKNIDEIVSDILQLLDKVKYGGLTSEDSKGSVITLLCKGESGVYAFTPIINQPEAAILGIGTVYERLIMTGGSIENRQFIMQSLTFDHRVINGSEADDFQRRLKEMLENPRVLL